MSADAHLQKLRRRAREVKLIANPDDCFAEKLCLLAEDGKTEEMITLLEEEGSDLTAPDCTGQYPLQVAVANARDAPAILLLDKTPVSPEADQLILGALREAEKLPENTKRRELVRLLSQRTGSPLSKVSPMHYMGDMGDAESDAIQDFKTSLHSTIVEAKNFDQHDQRYEETKAQHHHHHQPPLESNSPEVEHSGTSDTASEAPINWTTDSAGLILVMVGLPGRGKTYMARRLCRWLNWKGTTCRIYNVGKYRRDRTLGAAVGTQESSYFDPEDPDTSAEREQLAEAASWDLMDFIRRHAGGVAIFDATNSTLDRRAKLVSSFTSVLPKDRIIFIESVCTDDEVIRNNIIRAKIGNEDYQGKEAEYVLRDFMDRIAMYKKRYQPLSPSADADRSWVQLRNTINSHGGGHITVNNVSGHLPTKLLYFLFNLRTVVCPVYLATISSHQAFPAALRRWFNQPGVPETVRVWTSCEKPGRHCVKCFTGSRFNLRFYQALRSMDKGDCSGLADEQIKKQFPNMWREMRSNEYNYAWPRGESYRSINVRLEQIILDIHGSELPVLIVAEKEVIQGLYAYLAELLPELSVFLNPPSHSIAEMSYKSSTVNVQVHDLAGFMDEAPSAPSEDAFAEGVPPVPAPSHTVQPQEDLPDYVTMGCQISAVAVSQGSGEVSNTLAASVSLLPALHGAKTATVDNCEVVSS